MLLAQRDLLVRLEQVVARQQEQSAPLQATVTHLTQPLGERAAPPEAPPLAAGASAALAPTRVPGTKPTTVPPRPKQPRQRRAQGFARRRLPPTARHGPAGAQCPTCGIALVGGSVKRTRAVIEGPPVPVTVTEHVYRQRRCPGCQQRWTPPAEREGAAPASSGWGWGWSASWSRCGRNCGCPWLPCSGIGTPCMGGGGGWAAASVPSSGWRHGAKDGGSTCARPAAPARWCLWTRRAGGTRGRRAMPGPSAPPRRATVGGAVARGRGWKGCWGSPLPGCWSATSMPLCRLHHLCRAAPLRLGAPAA